MYRVHWGLREAPFRASLDPRSFYQTPNVEEALARLEFLVEERRRFGLCLGAPGCGKSMLLEVVSRQMRRLGHQVANVSLLGADVHEFLWLLAAEIGGNPGRHDSEFCLWRGITDRLAENRLQQLDTLILLDDADEAEPPVLDALARLAEHDRLLQSRLTIVAAACARNTPRLGNRLVELAELRIDLQPWDQADTGGYIVAALARVGRDEPVFTEEAIVRLHQMCDGIPRRINQLANLSLLAGAGRRDDRVGADTVESAFHELSAVEVSS